MRKTISSPMMTLRRRKAHIGLFFVWFFVLQAILGGLALAKAVPQQHAAILSGQSLCLPGGDGAAPANPHDHEACQLCPNQGTGPALPLPPNAQPVVTAAMAQKAASAIVEAQRTSARPDRRASGPRAPPAHA